MTLLKKQSPVFASREEAGKKLAELLVDARLGSPLIWAVPRGGVPVGKAIAKYLAADLELAPGPETQTAEPAEFASVTADRIDDQEACEVKDRDVIVVEDGVSTGAAVLAAAHMAKARGARRVLIATPVICGSAATTIKDEHQFELVALHVSDAYQSLEEFYLQFEAIKENEVRDAAPSSGEADGGFSRSTIEIEIDDRILGASLLSPAHPEGVVLLFGHELAWLEKLAMQVSQTAYAYVLADVTVADKARAIRHWFDKISREQAQGRPMACIATGETAAPGLEAAAAMPELIRCLVSICGAPDAAAVTLPRVMAATLLIAGESDKINVAGNRRALGALLCEKTLVLIPEMKSDFTRQESFEEIVTTTRSWLERFLITASAARGATLPELASIEPRQI